MLPDRYVASLRSTTKATASSAASLGYNQTVTPNIMLVEGSFIVGASDDIRHVDLYTRQVAEHARRVRIPERVRRGEQPRDVRWLDYWQQRRTAPLLDKVSARLEYRHGDLGSNGQEVRPAPCSRWRGIPFLTNSIVATKGIRLSGRSSRRIFWTTSAARQLEDRMNTARPLDASAFLPSGVSRWRGRARWAALRAHLPRRRPETNRLRIALRGPVVEKPIVKTMAKLAPTLRRCSRTEHAFMHPRRRLPRRNKKPPVSGCPTTRIEPPAAWVSPL
ncbi:unnamed protein product [Acanthosepion pharaonis]|uniref:Uncharacterized protein n=1 Tax=Acanthosepion pharaonis TaxID=158019 RepID=A0A812DRR2_ACAPH|nr:unnamed protein product [Sepia pharaonis]